MKHAEEKKGELYASIKIALEGFIPVGAYYGTQLMPQIEFLAIITLLSGFLFFVAAWYRKELKYALPKKYLGSFFAYTILVAVIPYGIIFYATKYSTAIDTALLLQTEAIFAAVLGWYVLKEKITRNRVLGLTLILCADAAILYKGRIELSVANIAIATAPVLFVFGNLIVKRLHNDGVMWAPVLLFRQLVGGIILLAISFLFEPVVFPSLKLWLFLLPFGIIGFGVSKLFWQIALQRMDVSKLTALLAITPIISAAISFAWLGEIPTVIQSFAITLTVLGVGFLLNTTSKQWTSAKTQAKRLTDY